MGPVCRESPSVPIGICNVFLIDFWQKWNAFFPSVALVEFFSVPTPGARVIPRFEQRKRLMKSRNRDFKFRFVPKVPVWLWRELFLCLCARKIRLLFWNAKSQRELNHFSRFRRVRHWPWSMAFSKENVAFFLNFAKFKIAGGDFCASGRAWLCRRRHCNFVFFAWNPLLFSLCWCAKSVTVAWNSPAFLKIQKCEIAKRTEPFFRVFDGCAADHGQRFSAKKTCDFSWTLQSSKSRGVIFAPPGALGSAAGGTHGVHASLEGSISSKCEITKRMNQLFAICEKHPPEKRWMPQYSEANCSYKKNSTRKALNAPI